jgi:hypothetical protein
VRRLRFVSGDSVSIDGLLEFVALNIALFAGILALTRALALWLLYFGSLWRSLRRLLGGVRSRPRVL